MFRIQMKDRSGGWVTLGGAWGGNQVGDRISGFQLYFMTRSDPTTRNSTLVCTREFRVIDAGGV